MGFPENFIWGAATASYQIEGAYNEDNKGLNIWDTYTRQEGKVKYFENGDIACDHYHRYKEDVALMKKIGIKYYRFSISWTRIFPDGTGEINQKGLDFYSDLVDELIKNGIEPVATLFHWDYPYKLHQKGGWMNPESPDWFEAYTKAVVDCLSDRVSMWMTINEPQCIVGCGFDAGIHAPFYKLPARDLIGMSFNIMLAHGKAVKYLRENAIKKPSIGFAPIGPVFIPENNSPQAIEEAKKKSFALGSRFTFTLSWWSDPIILGKFPDEAYELFGDLMPEYTDEQMALISQPLDFYACNIYYSNGDMTGRRPGNMWQGSPKTTTDWPVSPEVLYWSARFLYERYKLPILISENGMAGHDWVHLDGEVHDEYRIDYTRRYLREFRKAGEEGIPIMGYFYWSLMDNFEWGEGYDKRFGLIYVDYQTQKRTIKKSGYWYSEVIEQNGENI
ncbi:MAG: GH1 family beta-glucosidase [Oscillospiraceae bacterium]|nr:GH1 family beta-glucosidase [Oscillospiraceae bacterium]